MRKDKTDTTKLGLFVTIAIALFAFGVFKIGEQENLFGSTIQISSIFKNVNGLQDGNNVRFSGISIGSVNDIIILNDSTLKVNMMLDRNSAQFLKKDAIASIGTDGLVGNMIININPGKGDAATVSDGDIIKSQAKVGTEAMLSELGTTSENIALLSMNLLEVAEKINKGSGSVSSLINDDIIAKDLQKAIQNLKSTTEHFNALSSQLNNSMGKVSEGQGALGYLLNDTTLKSKVNLTIDDLDNLIANRTAPIMNNLEQSSKDIAVSSAELKALIEEIDLNSGLVGTILKDTAFSESVKETIFNLNEGSELLNEDLKALQHNFLFRRYFRKLEKEEKKRERAGVTTNQG